MKLTQAQLEPHLSKSLAAIYIVSGDEILLKQDVLQLIRKAAKQAGFNERIRITPEAGYDWEQLYSMLYSGSLLAEKRLFEFDFRDMTPNKVASAILQDYAKKPSPDNLLLIDISKVDDKIQKSAWYKALEGAGIAIPVWPIAREQLPQWISQRAKKYKLQINPDAAKLLADYVEGNLIAAAQALEKMYLLQPAQAVDTTLVQSILTDESRFTIFDFIENLIAGDKTRALHILEQLQGEGTEPTLILWAITRELRLMADLAQQHKNGSSFDSLFQRYRVFGRRQSAIRQFIGKHSAPACWQKLSHAAEIDQIIKGASPGNVWDALQLFCLRMV